MKTIEAGIKWMSDEGIYITQNIWQFSSRVNYVWPGPNGGMI